MSVELMNFNKTVDLENSKYTQNSVMNPHLSLPPLLVLTPVTLEKDVFFYKQDRIPSNKITFWSLISLNILSCSHVPS